jgi:hypothetical protein
MTVGPSGDDVPRVSGRLPGLARRLSRVPVWAAITAAARKRGPGRAVPATGHPSARDTGTGAGVTVARQRMREVMNRPGGRGVTVTMIVNWLASDQLEVRRSTVRRWLADDIRRGVAERVEPGLYRLRQPGEAGTRPRGSGPGERLR